MTEFEKWNMKQSTDILRNNDRLYAYVEEERESAWKAALRMIKYEGVISDYELAGKIIKDELKEK